MRVRTTDVADWCRHWRWVGLGWIGLGWQVCGVPGHCRSRSTMGDKRVRGWCEPRLHLCEDPCCVTSPVQRATVVLCPSPHSMPPPSVGHQPTTPPLTFHAPVLASSVPTSFFLPPAWRHFATLACVAVAVPGIIIGVTQTGTAAVRGFSVSWGCLAVALCIGASTQLRQKSRHSYAQFSSSVFPVYTVRTAVWC